MAEFVMPQIKYEGMSWTATDEDGKYTLPTYEPDEKKVREDLQAPLDYLAKQWNFPAEGEPREGKTLSEQLTAFCESFGGLTPVGVYNSSTIYHYLDLIEYKGNAYVAINNTAVLPTENAVEETEDVPELGFQGIAPDDEGGDDYWQLFVAGVTGATAELGQGQQVGVTVNPTQTASGGLSFGFTFNGLATSEDVAEVDAKFDTRPIIVKGTTEAYTLPTDPDVTICPMENHRILSISVWQIANGPKYSKYVMTGWQGYTRSEPESSSYPSMVYLSGDSGDSITFHAEFPRGVERTFYYIALVDPEEMEVEAT